MFPFSIFAFGIAVSVRAQTTEAGLKLAAELAAMVEVDQQAQGAATSPEIQAMEIRHLARMKEIIALVGWPGRSLVGEEGAQDAWILVQHCDRDLGFQEKCLSLLKRASDSGDAAKEHYAYLLDRVRVNEGKPQVFGTQMGESDLLPVEEPARLDERRRSVGLEPVADYVKRLRAFR